MIFLRINLHKLTFTTAHFHVPTAQFVINCTLKYALVGTVLCNNVHAYHSSIEIS